jgi:hypothetical protein
MNSKQAHAQLKKINAQRNAIGVGGYKNSRRTQCDRHEELNESLNEINKLSDKIKMEKVDSYGNKI